MELISNEILLVSLKRGKEGKTRGKTRSFFPAQIYKTYSQVYLKECISVTVSPLYFPVAPVT